MQSTNITTQIIHRKKRSATNFSATPMPLYRASTILFDSCADMRARIEGIDYTYGLKGTPTQWQLQDQLAAIEGGNHCLLMSSGLAAITVVDLALLRPGDELLIQSSCYGPNRIFAEQVLSTYDITCKFFDALDLDELKQQISPRCKLVWVEVPGSITMDMPDIANIAEIVHQTGALLAVDHTWSAGIAFSPFKHGVDIAIQALTKYQSGGADVLMGSIVTTDQHLFKRIWKFSAMLGMGVSASDCDLILRSLPSLELRYRAQFDAVMQLLHWFEKQPKVCQLLYPAWPSSPGYQAWLKQCNGVGAGIFSVVFDKKVSAQQVDAFIDALKLWQIGYSWAGPCSLALPSQPETLRNGQWPPSGLSEPLTKDWGILVRFCLGMESVEDLKADIQQAYIHLL